MTASSIREAYGTGRAAMCVAVCVFSSSSTLWTKNRTIIISKRARARWMCACGSGRPKPAVMRRRRRLVNRRRSHPGGGGRYEYVGGKGEGTGASVEGGEWGRGKRSRVGWRPTGGRRRGVPHRYTIQYVCTHVLECTHTRNAIIIIIIIV